MVRETTLARTYNKTHEEGVAIALQFGIGKRIQGMELEERRLRDALGMGRRDS